MGLREDLTERANREVARVDLPAAINIIFILNANQPVKGSIYFDRIGFMVR